MLLPNNVHPKDSIFYNGGLILNSLLENREQDFIALFQSVQSKMSFNIFILSLDWLYLINLATLNESGDIELCI